MQTYHDFILISSHAEINDPDMREYIELWVTSQSNIGISNSYHLLAGQKASAAAQMLCEMLVAKADRRLGFARYETPDF